MGTGGAPEGVLTAAAMRCLNGEIQGKLVLTKPADAERLKKMGIFDLKRVYGTEDLAPGKTVVFAAAGVTDGSLLRGVRFFGEGIRTHCLVMTTVPHQVRFIDTIHAKDDPNIKIRF
jgi:fructose-1,6-bisphosphatase II